MPTRMIREGLLDSDRYGRVSDAARLLFVHLMLLADDFGCVSVSATFLRRRCFYDSPSDERIARLVCELVDVDLIRTYEVDRACLAFIPRFRQRLYRSTLKHAIPPAALYQDDDDAAEKFKEISKEKQETPVLPPESPVLPPPEVKRREEKQAPALPDWLPKEAWNAYLEMRKKLRKAPTDRAIELVIAKLLKLKGEGHSPVAVLEQSVRNSWQDVFPLREPAVVSSLVKRAAF